MTVVVVFLLYDFYVGLFLLSHCNPSYVLIYRLLRRC